MKTRTQTDTKDNKTTSAARERECLPCDLPPFCRNNYFTGKLLTAHDLTAEQRYFTDKMRLHNLALHGWGVVCGLKVKPHRYCPDQRIVFEPGLAIDPCGREIRVLHEVEIELPDPEPSPSGGLRPPLANDPPFARSEKCDSAAANRSRAVAVLADSFSSTAGGYVSWLRQSSRCWYFVL